jgi:hypothetical protein
MILKNNGETFKYNGVTYTIGGDIVCMEASDEFEGLTGIVLEIRDGEDKETDNITPDIYCMLNEPTTPELIEEIEERFSDSYCEPKAIDEICFDNVIMAPYMIRPLSQ